MIEGGPPEPQVQFFYRNTSGFLDGENFRSSWSDGLPDSINVFTFKMGDCSPLAAYWPLVFYESESSGLKSVWYSPNGTGYSTDPKPLSAESAPASTKTPVAVLPLQRVHPSNDHTVELDIKLLYRGDDRYIYEFDRWSNGTVTKNER